MDARCRVPPDAGTHTETDNDHDDCSARLPGAALTCAREATDSNRTLRVQGGRGSLPSTRSPAPPFHRALCPSRSQAALYGSGREQHAEHISVQREMTADSASGPDQGWIARPIVSTTRRDTALREERQRLRRRAVPHAAAPARANTHAVSASSPPRICKRCGLCGTRTRYSSGTTSRRAYHCGSGLRFVCLRGGREALAIQVRTL